MPPLYRPPILTGKQSPHVLTRDLAMLVDLGDGVGWPLLLLIPTDAGLMLPCEMFHPLECDNDDTFGESARS
jgi:hypothetical protein